MNFPSVRGGQGLSKGRQGLGERGGVAGGLEQGSWGLGRVSKGLGGWGLERAELLGSGGGWTLRGRPDGRSLARSFVRSDVRTDGKFIPLSYRTSSPSGPLPKKGKRTDGRRRRRRRKENRWSPGKNGEAYGEDETS